MSGKMPAPSLLRLNSIGEVSAESFPERQNSGKGKLGFSKSLDSVCPSKRFSSSTSRPTSVPSAYHNMMHASHIMDMEPPLQSSPITNTFWSLASMPFYQQSAMSNMFPCFNYKKIPLSHPSGFERVPSIPEPLNRNPFPSFTPRRMPGLLPSVMFASMPASPMSSVQKRSEFQSCQAGSKPSPRKCSQHKEHIDKGAVTINGSQSSSIRVADLNSEVRETPSEHKMKDTCPPNEENNLCLNMPECTINKLGITGEENNLCLFNKLECTVDKLDITGSAVNNNVGNVIHINSDLPSGLKRRNDKIEEDALKSNCQPKCPLTGVINDLTSVLFLRKTPKKGRPSCKKRKKRQHQGNPSTQHHSVPDHKTPSSPLPIAMMKPQAPVATQSTVAFQASIKPLLSSSPKSRPSFVSNVFRNPESDSESSDNEDFDDDSMNMLCGSPKSLSSPISFGSSLFQDSLFKRRNQSSATFDDSSDSSASSPSPKKSLCLSVSISISEDDESEKSFDSVSASPSDQLILDFGFGNGLCLEAIFGKKTEAKISNGKCNTIFSHDKFPSPQASHLREINTAWNKCYPDIPAQLARKQNKVQFASEEDLVEMHTIGNEERRGTWYEDGQRFKKRILDVERSLDFIFTDCHRKKVYERMGLNDV